MEYLLFVICNEFYFILVFSKKYVYSIYIYISYHYGLKLFRIIYNVIK